MNITSKSFKYPQGYLTVIQSKLYQHLPSNPKKKA